MNNRQIKPLSSVCAFINRGITPQYVEQGGVLVLNQKCIRDQRVSLTEARRTDDLGRPIPRDRFLEAFDILVNSTGVGTLGRVAQIRELPERMTADSHVTIVRADPAKVFPPYLGFVLRLYQPRIESLAEGSTGQTELSRARLGELEIPLPGESEQRSIARILGALDDKISVNRRMNRTLEAIAWTIFVSWFVEFAPVRAKADGRKLALTGRIANLFPDRLEDSELGAIPAGWRVGAFSSAVKIVGGGTPKTVVPDYWGGDIPWFSVVDTPPEGEIFVVDTEKHITQGGLENSSARILPEGTSIISARGTVGQVSLVGTAMAMNQSCYGLIGKDDARGFFTYFTARSLVSTLKQRSHGSVFDTVTRETFDSLLMSIPPAAVVETFDRIVAPFLDRVLVNVHESRSLTALRDSLLPKLISGELRAPSSTDSSRLRDES